MKPGSTSFTPFSQGTVNINGTNILTLPFIDFCTMLDPVDTDLILTALFKNMDIMSQLIMAVLGVREASPFGKQTHR